MYLTHRKKLLLCLLVLVLCLWVIYQTSQLALQYDKSMVSLQWEVDRCIHKQGLDPQSRLGPEGLLSHYTLTAYPEGLVSISPAALHHSNKHFTTRAPAHLRDKVSDQLSSLMWPVSVTSDPWPVCTHYHDEGYVFTVSVPDERGWYEHLHTHTLLPLYALLAYRSHTGPHSVDGNSVALLPAVENYELQSVDWGSTVLSEEHGVVQEMLKTFAGSVKILPLSESTLHHSEHTTCFMTLHLGVGSVNLRDPSLLSGFVELVLSRLSLPLTTPTQPLLCLAVGGLLTQHILNAPQLLEAVRGGVAAQILDFSGLSYREQVSQTQLCTIMAGFHGDDLVNALYMSADSVTILLRPLIHSEEQSNVYSDLARARGHYLEWTNPIEDTHRPGNGPTNTEVDVDTFVELIDNALTLGINSRLLRT